MPKDQIVDNTDLDFINKANMALAVFAKRPDSAA